MGGSHLHRRDSNSAELAADGPGIDLGEALGALPLVLFGKQPAFCGRNRHHKQEVHLHKSFVYLSVSCPRNDSASSLLSERRRKSAILLLQHCDSGQDGGKGAHHNANNQE